MEDYQENGWKKKKGLEKSQEWGGNFAVDPIALIFTTAYLGQSGVKESFGIVGIMALL